MEESPGPLASERFNIAAKEGFLEEVKLVGLILSAVVGAVLGSLALVDWLDYGRFLWTLRFR